MNNRILLLLAAAAFNLPAQELPTIGSGTLVLHLKADPASVTVDGSNNVTAWQAENDPSISLAPGGAVLPGTIVYDPVGMNGSPTIVVTDDGNPFLAGNLPGSVDLTDTTVFWLGYYGRSVGAGQYVYTIGSSAGNGATQLSHQEQSGNIEIFNGDSTFVGDPIVEFRSIYTAWTTRYFGGSPTLAHVAAADGIGLNVPSNGIGYDVGPASHPVSLFAFQQGGFNFEGEFAELLVYDGILSPDDIAAVEAYLQARSGETPPLDLTSGEIVQYEFGCQPDANWILRPSGRTLDQLENSDASIYLLDQETRGAVIRGRLAASGAPDFMGIVVAYQDRGSYYLFDWKRVTASFCNGNATQGMRLRRIQVPGGADPGGAEMWGSPASTNITVLASNDIPWEPNTDYEFEVELNNGQIDIEIREGATVIESWSVSDSTFTGGRFGLYVNSLQNVVFGPIRVDRDPSPIEAAAVPALPVFLLVLLGAAMVSLVLLFRRRRIGA